MFDIEIFFTNFFKLPKPVKMANWIKVSVDMAVHTKKRIPEELLLCRRPNETTEIFNYRLKTYKPITYGSMNRATDELYRIVSGINFKINCSDDTKRVLFEQKYNNFTFILYLQQIILRRMLEDPNGLLVWLPNKKNYSDTSEKATTVPYIVCSRDIHYIDNDVISFLSSEKSLVQEGKNDVYNGNVFYVVTKDSFYKLSQYGRASDNKYQTILVYEHNIGEIPYLVLGGDMNEEGFYDSFFAPYLAFGDEAICQFSDWQAIMVTTSHPFVEEFQVECEVIEKPFNKESNPIPEGEEIYVGKKHTMSPMGRSPYNRIIRKIPTGDQSLMSEPTLDPKYDSIKFIHPDINVAKYVGEAWQMLIDKAEDALHLNLGRGLLSGDAKDKDKESQQSMMLKIGNNFYDNIMLNSIVYIDAYNSYRSADRAGISIDTPKTYDIKTEEDVLNEITTLKEKNAPAFFLANATIDLAQKRFSGDKLMQKVFNTISILDPLYIYSVEEKNELILSGIITKDSYVMSVYIYSLLLQIIQENGGDYFLNMEIKEIKEMLLEKIKPLIPPAGMQIVNPDGTTGPKLAAAK